MLPGYNKKARGYTLVEILVAASVFSLFFMGVFNLYRMGSNMFVYGSWKLQKQKDAERFLAILRERLEMASSPTVVTNADVNERPVHIYTLASGSEVIEPAGTTRLLLFAVCKPNIQITNTRGMIMPHILTMQRNPANTLSTLILEGHSQMNFPGINADFVNELNAGVTIGDFSAGPQDFDLGNSTGYRVVLNEVHSVRVFLGAASGTIIADSSGSTGQTLGLEVTMRNPRSAETMVTQSIFARINDAAPIRTRLPNEL
jgi:prepilin-type N-terminal cleavage/methylation domain-containing protein